MKLLIEIIRESSQAAWSKYQRSITHGCCTFVTVQQPLVQTSSTNDTSNCANLHDCVAVLELQLVVEMRKIELFIYFLTQSHGGNF